MFGTPPEALRNTASLEAWRAYNAKASRPLILATAFPGVLTGSMVPLTAALARSHHPITAAAVGIAAIALLTLNLAWVVFAALKVRAYRREHPFVPPKPTGRQARMRERSVSSLAGRL